MGLRTWLVAGSEAGRGVRRLAVKIPIYMLSRLPHPGAPVVEGPGLSSGQRRKLLECFAASGQEFTSSLRDLSEEQWKWKPGGEKWTIAFVAEHVVLAEGLLFAKVEEALSYPNNPDWKQRTIGKTEFLLRAMPSRQIRVKAPDSLLPHGNWTVAEAIARFEEIRKKTVAFAKESQQELNSRTAEHPFTVFNTLSAYQWLLYIPLHQERHTRQILGIQSMRGFPK